MASVFAITSFSSCKKDNENGSSVKLPSRKSGGNLPEFTTREQINSHLKWIARGVAHWPKSSAFVHYVDSITTITSNDSNQNSLAYIQTQQIFVNPLKDTFNLKLAGHDFDTDGILGLKWNTIEFGTYVHIPRKKQISTNKPFVVIAQDMNADSITDMEYTGYFLNSSGAIDSVLIDDDNEHNYYIWLIDIVSPDEYFDLWESYDSSGFDVVRRKSAAWKVDCDGVCASAGTQANPACNCPGVDFRLEISTLRINTDNHTYREKWLGGKYEFAVSVGLVEDGIPYIVNPASNLKIQKFKAKDVCRKKGGNIKHNSNNCNSADHVINWAIFGDGTIRIDPNKDLHLVIIFYERDRIFTRRDGLPVGSPAYTVYNWDSEHCFDMFNVQFFPANDPGSCNQYLWHRTHQSIYGAGVIDLKAVSQQTSTGGFQWLGTNDEADIKIELTKL